MDKDAFAKELGDLEALYEQTTGQPMMKFYRPPQGKYSENNLQIAKDLGYKTFFWSLAYVDWDQDKQPTHEEAFDKLLKRVPVSYTHLDVYKRQGLQGCLTFPDPK